MPRLTPELMRRFLEKEGREVRKKIYRRFHDQSWDLAKCNVLILHGYREHNRKPHLKELANTLDDELLANVVSCDLPNFGKSEPADPKYAGQVPSFARLVNVAKSLTYLLITSKSKRHVPTFIVGYSLGALTILRLLQTYPGVQDYIAGVICIAAPLRVEHNADPKILKYQRFIEPFFGVFSEMRPHASVSKYVPDEFSEGDPEHFKGDMEAITAKEILKASRRARERMQRIRIPVLFIHGEDDHVAPLSAVLEAFKGVATPEGKKHMLIYKGVDHLVLQRHKRAIADIVEWIQARTKENPATAFSRDEVDSNIATRSARQLFFILFSALTMLLELFWEVLLEMWGNARAWYKRLF